jgi:dynein heavy chain, axonemal
MTFDKARWWINWTQTVEKYVVPKDKDSEYHKIYVPTIDSIRNTYFLHKCVENKIHMMYSGPTGTGKTLTIVNELA